MANTSNYKSINQIIGIFRDLSGWHKQLNDFGYGPEYQIGRRRDMNYPFLWVSLDNPTDLPRGSNGYSTIDYNITIHVYDKLNNELKEDDKLGEESNNAIEVTSDTSQIVMDLVQLLYRHPLYKNMNLSLEGDISLNYEYDVWDDGDNGTVTDLTIRSLYDGGWCSAPIDIPGYETAGMLLPDYNSIEDTICDMLSTCPSFIGLSSDVLLNTNNIIDNAAEIVNNNVDIFLLDYYLNISMGEIINIKNELNKNTWYDLRSSSPYNTFTINDYTVHGGNSDIVFKNAIVNRTSDGIEITGIGTSENNGFVSFRGDGTINNKSEKSWKWKRGSNRTLEFIFQVHSNGQYTQVGIGDINVSLSTASYWNGFGETLIQYNQSVFGNIISNNGTPGQIRTQSLDSVPSGSGNYFKCSIYSDGTKYSRVKVYKLDNSTDWDNNSNLVIDKVTDGNLTPGQDELCLWMTPVRSVVQTIIAFRVIDGSDFYKLPTIKENVYTDSIYGTYNLDWINSNLFELEITGDVDISSISQAEGQQIVVVLKQDGIGGHIVNWSSEWLWSGGTAPVMTPDVNAKDVYTFVMIGGTIYGSYIQNFS